MHQRRCRITVGLHGDTFEYLEEEISDNRLDDESVSDINHVLGLQLSGIKPGVRLPKSHQQWSMANDFSKPASRSMISMQAQWQP